MKHDSAGNVVAVYWDFENIHASLFDLAHGANSYQDPKTRFVVQDALVDIKAVMEFVATIGNVAINRAYANWQFFSRYRDGLNEAGVDLIQLYSRGRNMKNGADIRLALDVVEDINHYSHVTHAVIVGSDSDYISVAQKVKQSGRIIIGVGVRESTNEFWEKCCNEFKYYQTLLRKVGQTGDAAVVPAAGKSEDAERLLMSALKRLISQRGENKVPNSQLKSLMLRMDATFDEENFGFPTFKAFLAQFSDKIQFVDNNSGGHVGLTKVAFEKEFSTNPGASIRKPPAGD
ncbi:MAG: NYN domain-containing protein [Pyrinomonadaceae bacterium]